MACSSLNLRSTLLVDCAGFVFPTYIIHLDIKVILDQLLETTKVKKSVRYIPPKWTLEQLGILSLGMAFDFSLFLGCALESSRMITLWVVGSPMRMLIFLGDGAWIVRTLKSDSPTLYAEIGEAAHCFLEFLVSVLGVVVAMQYWDGLEVVRLEEQLKERRRHEEDVERLRMAVAASLLTHHAGAPPEEGSDDSLDAAPSEVLYVRAAPQTLSYAYRHQRDRTYYAPRIAY